MRSGKLLMAVSLFVLVLLLAGCPAQGKAKVNVTAKTGVTGAKAVSPAVKANATAVKAITSSTAKIGKVSTSINAITKIAAAKNKTASLPASLNITLFHHA